MMGDDKQQKLFNSFRLYGHLLHDTSIYAFLAKNRHTIFHPKDFEDCYHATLGRYSHPVVEMNSVLLLQIHDNVSEREAERRTRFDLSWKMALGLEPEHRGFSRSSIQGHRVRLLLHDKDQLVFKRGVQAAAQAGFIDAEVVLAVDSSPILGRGAVKDSYNLIGAAIKKLLRALGYRQKRAASAIAKELELDKLLQAPSVKGAAEIDWADEEQRKQFLGELVAGANRLADVVKDELDGIEPPQDLQESLQLLLDIIGQDTKEDDDGQVVINRGVAEDRIVSTSDPEMRHGRKSKSNRYDGYKGHLGCDTDSGFILGVDVTPPNVADADVSLDMVEQAEENSGSAVDKAIGDCGYGDGQNREDFVKAGRVLTARQPSQNREAGGRFGKGLFHIDLEQHTVRCPYGATATEYRFISKTLSKRARRAKKKKTAKVAQFTFDKADCMSCPLRDQCCPKPGEPRKITLHPQEKLIQQARKYQKTEEFLHDMRRRAKAEHSWARVKQLGGGQARYFGVRKLLYQLRMTATAANLVKLWRRIRARICDGEVPFSGQVRPIFGT